MISNFKTLFKLKVGIILCTLFLSTKIFAEISYEYKSNSKFKSETSIIPGVFEGYTLENEPSAKLLIGYFENKVFLEEAHSTSDVVFKTKFAEEARNLDGLNNQTDRKLVGFNKLNVEGKIVLQFKYTLKKENLDWNEATTYIFSNTGSTMASVQFPDSLPADTKIELLKGIENISVGYNAPKTVYRSIQEKFFGYLTSYTSPNFFKNIDKASSLVIEKSYAADSSKGDANCGVKNLFRPNGKSSLRDSGAANIAKIVNAIKAEVGVMSEASRSNKKVDEDKMNCLKNLLKATEDKAKNYVQEKATEKNCFRDDNKFLGAKDFSALQKSKDPADQKRYSECLDVKIAYNAINQGAKDLESFLKGEGPEPYDCVRNHVNGEPQLDDLQLVIDKAGKSFCCEEPNPSDKNDKGGPLLQVVMSDYQKHHDIKGPMSTEAYNSVVNECKNSKYTANKTADPNKSGLNQFGECMESIGEGIIEVIKSTWHSIKSLFDLETYKALGTLVMGLPNSALEMVKMIGQAIAADAAAVTMCMSDEDGKNYICKKMPEVAALFLGPAAIKKFVEVIGSSNRVAGLTALISKAVKENSTIQKTAAIAGKIAAPIKKGAAAVAKNRFVKPSLDVLAKAKKILGTDVSTPAKNWLVGKGKKLTDSGKTAEAGAAEVAAEKIPVPVDPTKRMSLNPEQGAELRKEVGIAEPTIAEKQSVEKVSQESAVKAESTAPRALEEKLPTAPEDRRLTPQEGRDLRKQLDNNLDPEKRISLTADQAAELRRQAGIPEPTIAERHAAESASQEWSAQVKKNRAKENAASKVSEEKLPTAQEDRRLTIQEGRDLRIKLDKSPQIGNGTRSVKSASRVDENVVLGNSRKLDEHLNNGDIAGAQKAIMDDFRAQGKEISPQQANAIIEAHGSSLSACEIGKCTPQQLVEKARIMKNAGFDDPATRRMAIERGWAGSTWADDKRLIELVQQGKTGQEAKAILSQEKLRASLGESATKQYAGDVEHYSDIGPTAEQNAVIDRLMSPEAKKLKLVDETPAQLSPETQRIQARLNEILKTEPDRTKARKILQQEMTEAATGRGKIGDGTRSLKSASRVDENVVLGNSRKLDEHLNNGDIAGAQKAIMDDFRAQGKEISPQQANAIIEAHGSPLSACEIGKCTPQQLAEKARIMKNAGFDDPATRRMAIERGWAGTVTKAQPTPEEVMAAMNELYGGGAPVSNALDLSRGDLNLGIKSGTEVRGLKGQGNLEIGDRLGTGGSGVVYDIKRPGHNSPEVIKLPITQFKNNSLVNEIEAAKKFDEAGIPIAKIIEADPKGSFIISEKVIGTKAEEIIKKGLNEDQIKNLADIYKKGKEHKLQLDLKPDNLVWDESKKSFVFIDRGFANTTESILYNEDHWSRIFLGQDTTEAAKFKQLVAEPKIAPGRSAIGDGSRSAGSASRVDENIVLGNSKKLDEHLTSGDIAGAQKAIMDDFKAQGKEISPTQANAIIEAHGSKLSECEIGKCTKSQLAEKVRIMDAAKLDEDARRIAIERGWAGNNKIKPGEMTKAEEARVIKLIQEGKTADQAVREVRLQILRESAGESASAANAKFYNKFDEFIVKRKLPEKELPPVEAGRVRIGEGSRTEASATRVTEERINRNARNMRLSLEINDDEIARKLIQEDFNSIGKHVNTEQAQAIIEAHRDPLASCKIGECTPKQLARKVELMKAAGIDDEARRAAIERGWAGNLGQTGTKAGSELSKYEIDAQAIHGTNRRYTAKEADITLKTTGVKIIPIDIQNMSASEIVGAHEQNLLAIRRMRASTIKNFAEPKHAEETLVVARVGKVEVLQRNKQTMLSDFKNLKKEERVFISNEILNKQLTPAQQDNLYKITSAVEQAKSVNKTIPEDSIRSLLKLDFSPDDVNRLVATGILGI